MYNTEQCYTSKGSTCNPHFSIHRWSLRKVRSLMERNTDTGTSANACRITVFNSSSVFVFFFTILGFNLTSPTKHYRRKRDLGYVEARGLVQIYLPSDLQNVDSEIPSFLRPYELVLRPAEDVKKAKCVYHVELAKTACAKVEYKNQLLLNPLWRMAQSSTLQTCHNCWRMLGYLFIKMWVCFAPHADLWSFPFWIKCTLITEKNIVTTSGIIILFQYCLTGSYPCFIISVT